MRVDTLTEGPKLEKEITLVLNKVVENTVSGMANASERPISTIITHNG